jgi:hypothetical protein
MLSLLLPEPLPLRQKALDRLQELGVQIVPEWRGNRIYLPVGVSESVSLILAGEFSYLRENNPAFELIPDSHFWDTRHAPSSA